MGDDGTRIRLSCQKFAHRFGLDARALQEWEQGLWVGHRGKTETQRVSAPQRSAAPGEGRVSRERCVFMLSADANILDHLSRIQIRANREIDGEDGGTNLGRRPIGRDIRQRSWSEASVPPRKVQDKDGGSVHYRGSWTVTIEARFFLVGHPIERSDVPVPSHPLGLNLLLLL